MALPLPCDLDCRDYVVFVDVETRFQPRAVADNEASLRSLSPLVVGPLELSTHIDGPEMQVAHGDKSKSMKWTITAMYASRPKHLDIAAGLRVWKLPLDDVAWRAHTGAGNRSIQYGGIDVELVFEGPRWLVLSSAYRYATEDRRSLLLGVQLHNPTSVIRTVRGLDFRAKQMQCTHSCHGGKTPSPQVLELDWNVIIERGEGEALTTVNETRVTVPATFDGEELTVSVPVWLPVLAGEPETHSVLVTDKSGGDGSAAVRMLNFAHGWELYVGVRGEDTNVLPSWLQVTPWQ